MPRLAIRQPKPAWLPASRIAWLPQRTATTLLSGTAPSMFLVLTGTKRSPANKEVLSSHPNAQQRPIARSSHLTPGLLCEDYFRATITTCHSCLSPPGALVCYGSSVARLTFVIHSCRISFTDILPSPKEAPLHKCTFWTNAMTTQDDSCIVAYELDAANRRPVDGQVGVSAHGTGII